MQTFRISKVQEQSYYAIRIFGVVHLIAAVGIVVLLDGPGNGLRGISWVLIFALLSLSAFLLVRVFQARAGRIHGHYVLTRNTLAILLPGQPRMFVRREDCTGFLPASSALVLRNKRRIYLRSSSSKPCLKDLVNALGRMWWSGLYGTPLWRMLVEENPEGTFTLRVDFRAEHDGREPLLVFSPSRSYWIWHAGGPIACVCLFFLFLIYVYLSLAGASSIPKAPVPLLTFLFTVFAGGLGAGGALFAFCDVIRKILFEKSLRQAYVLSRRGFAVMQAGRAPVFYRHESLVQFNWLTGRLFFENAPPVVAASYLYGGAHYDVLRCLFARWRPGENILPVTPFRTGNNLYTSALTQWLCVCTILGPYSGYQRFVGRPGESVFELAIGMGVLLVALVCAFELRKKLAERTELSKMTNGLKTSIKQVGALEIGAMREKKSSP